MHNDDVGTGWWIVMMIGMGAFWVAVIAVIVWVLRGGLERRAPQPPEDPLQTLDRRLAEGAISPEEYTERKHLLSGHSG